MSYTIVTNVPEVSSPAATTIPIAGIDSSQYAITLEKAGELRYKNVLSPLGFPQTFDIKQRLMQNIYNGTKVPSVQQLPLKQGIELHLALHESWTQTPVEASDPSCCCDTPSYAMPVTASITIRVPNNPLITEKQVYDLIGRLIGILRNTTDGDLLGNYLRGALRLS